MSTLSPGAILRLWFEEVWNQRRPDRIAAYLAPDGVIHALDETGADGHGPEPFRAFHARMLGAFPDLHFTLHDIIEEGPMAAGRWSVRLTHSGEGLGIAPTGETVTLSGMAMLRVRDGQVVEAWNLWDRMSLAMACRMVVPAA
jgi:predicted ester cyclase